MKGRDYMEFKVLLRTSTLKVIRIISTNHIYRLLTSNTISNMEYVLVYKNNKCIGKYRDEYDALNGIEEYDNLHV